MKYFPLLFLLWTPLVTPAEPTRWQLTLDSYSAASGDSSASLGEYRLDGGDSEKECLRRAELALKYYKSGTVEAGPTLPRVWCDSL